MQEKTKKCLDTINQIPFVRQNLFVVTITKQNQQETLFPLNEIEYFHEEKRKKVVIKLRCSFDNLPKIYQMSNEVYKCFPSCLISNKNKYQITLSLLSPDLVENGVVNYSGCVLKNISYPMFFYGKGSDSIATVYFEFKYSKKEFVDKNENKDKEDINRLLYKYDNIFAPQFIKYIRPVSDWPENSKCNVSEEDFVKNMKILDSSNEMLDNALKVAKKHYDELCDKDGFDSVKEQIETAKKTNTKKKKKLESQLNTYKELKEK